MNDTCGQETKGKDSESFVNRLRPISLIRSPRTTRALLHAPFHLKLIFHLFFFLLPPSTLKYLGGRRLSEVTSDVLYAE